MSRLSIADLEVAAEWLDYNEGDDGEGDACRRVAAWLRAEAERREAENTARHIARKTGASLAQVRAALRRRAAR